MIMKEVKGSLSGYKSEINTHVVTSQLPTTHKETRRVKKKIKMFVAIFLVLSISMLTQSAPAAEPEPAPCSIVPEPICETRSSIDENGRPIQEERCRIVERISASCFDGK